MIFLLKEFFAHIVEKDGKYKLAMMLLENRLVVNQKAKNQKLVKLLEKLEKNLMKELTLNIFFQII